MTSKDDTLTFWLDKAGRYQVLPDSEVIRLSKVIHEKGLDSRAGKKAIEKLVRHNLKLIPGIVRKAIGGRKKVKFGDDHTIDLLQAGVFGLTRAAEKFDYKLGYKFSTYAHMWVRQFVQRHLYKLSSMIHVPETYHRDIIKMDEPEYRKKMSEMTEVRRQCTVHAYRALGGFCTLDYSDEDGKELARADTDLVTKPLEAMDKVEDLFDLASIDDLNRKLVYAVHCTNKPIQQVAQELGIDRNKVAKSNDCTLKKMKNSLDRKTEMY